MEGAYINVDECLVDTRTDFLHKTKFRGYIVVDGCKRFGEWRVELVQAAKDHLDMFNDEETGALYLYSEV